MSDENQNSVFSLFPNHKSILGNWAKELKEIENEVFIKKIIGSDEIFVGKSYVFAVEEFNKNDFNLGLVNSKLKWEYSTEENKTYHINEKNKQVNSIFWKIPDVEGNSLIISAWIEGTNNKVSFKTKLLRNLQIDRDLFLKELNSNVFKIKELSNDQILGILSILNKRDGEYPNIDLRQLAYIFATVYWETGHKMQPVDEIGKGNGKPYGIKQKYNGDLYGTPDYIYFGRGLVQLTWYENYEEFGKKLGYDLLNNPDWLTSRFDVSLEVLFKGMTKGWFTGVGLSNYFNDKKEDWIMARKIINGPNCVKDIKGKCLKNDKGKFIYEELPDKAKEIAEIAKNIYKAILKSCSDTPIFLRPNEEVQ